jgi:hypothetical protein
VTSIAPLAARSDAHPLPRTASSSVQFPRGGKSAGREQGREDKKGKKEKIYEETPWRIRG